MHRRTLAPILWAALACWAVAILVLSSLTPQELPDPAFWFGDKVNHVTAYALGGGLAASALRVSRPQLRPSVTILLAVSMIAAFGILDEVVQTFTPGRSGADVGDWLADVLGAITGALITARTLRKFGRRS